MSFKKEKIEFYLNDTGVENIFINEYLPYAKGEYVKVYLLALMYAGHDDSISNETIAKYLNIEIEDVFKAWNYWESLGLIKKRYLSKSNQFDYNVTFLSLKKKMFKDAGNKETELPNGNVLLVDHDLKELFQSIEEKIGRFFDGNEVKRISSWIEDYSLEPEVVLRAYEYCAEKNKTKFSYVEAVLKNWVLSEVKTIDDLEKYLEEHDKRHYTYKKIFNNLGFRRFPTEEEKRLMDTWIDEFGFPLERILEACKKTAGITNPNLNYINSILKNWKEGKEKPTNYNAHGNKSITTSNTVSVATKKYEEIRQKNQELLEKRKKSVYLKVPKIEEIDLLIKELSLNISRMILKGSQSKDGVKEIRNKISALNEEKAFLLTENGFEMDYLNLKYDCNQCKDTGRLESGEVCQCYKA